MNKKFNLPKGFTVTFHAGFMNTPANSVESVKKAVEMNADVVEIDVTFRDDGTPVIVHASSAGKSGGVPLDEVLAVVAGHPTCRLNIDMKSVANIAAVDSAVKAKGLEGRAFYTGIGKGWVDTVKQNSTLPFYLNHSISFFESKSTRKLTALAEKVRDCGACGLNSNFRRVNGKVTGVFHNYGLPVSVWTCNEEKDMLRMLKTRPDNITTRRPDRLLDLLG